MKDDDVAKYLSF